jgi:hypothetical protein
LKDNEYENAILSRLAVLGIYREKNGRVPAIFYIPTLAAIITSNVTVGEFGLYGISAGILTSLPRI